MAKNKPKHTVIGNTLRDYAAECKLGKAMKISLRSIAIEFDLLTVKLKYKDEEIAKLKKVLEKKDSLITKGLSEVLKGVKDGKVQSKRV